MGDKEHIQRLLEKGHSSALRDEIVRYVGNSPKRMKALMHFFFHEKLQYCQRSSWPVGHIGLKYPNLVRPYAHQMIEVMDNPQHDAVVRNILRIYEEVEIPEDVEGPLCDKCFEFIENPKNAVAIRAFALTVLQRIARKFPELQQELVAQAKEIMPTGTAALKVRCRRILKEFDVS